MSANWDNANIELRINELVLHGFARGDRERIGAAVQQELQRQLTEQGFAHALLQPGNVRRLDAGAIQIQQGGQAETIGRQVAQAVYGSVTGEQSRRAAQAGGNLKGSNIE
jgi:hypothetical protein